ncbi:MAG: general secretion pathway protein GspK [Acidobacteriaceae bacterium]|nr:general secretion pathway protein GspK [Acidobacteriaceae bacterium]
MSERGMQRGLALGALALVQARLDQARRVAPPGTTVHRLRASDPWLAIDSLYTGTVMVDSLPVEVVAQDLGEKLNINSLAENDIRSFFNYLLKDYAKATQLSQTIMDWRDADSIPRPEGAEKDAYLKAGMLALPANAPFREVDDLRNVMGMTPEIYAQASPYFTTRGTGTVNMNTAPVPVLRALPGMTDQTLNMILQLRSQGRRIENIQQVFTALGGKNGGAGLLATQGVLAPRVTVSTQTVQFVITARTGPQSQPTKLTAIINRVGTTAVITNLVW